MYRTISRAFTLVEVLVAVALAGGGLAFVVAALGNIEKGEAKALSHERLQRLAVQKMDELLSTQQTSSQSGDFTDQGITDVTWTYTMQTTSVQNLDAFTLEVSKAGDDTTKQSVTTLLYVPAGTGSSSSTGGTP